MHGKPNSTQVLFYKLLIQSVVSWYLQKLPLSYLLKVVSLKPNKYADQRETGCTFVVDAEVVLRQADKGVLVLWAPAAGQRGLLLVDKGVEGLEPVHATRATAARTAVAAATTAAAGGSAAVAGTAAAVVAVVAGRRAARRAGGRRRVLHSVFRSVFYGAVSSRNRRASSRIRRDWLAWEVPESTIAWSHQRPISVHHNNTQPHSWCVRRQAPFRGLLLLLLGGSALKLRLFCHGSSVSHWLVTTLPSPSVLMTSPFLSSPPLSPFYSCSLVNCDVILWTHLKAPPRWFGFLVIHWLDATLWFRFGFDRVSTRYCPRLYFPHSRWFVMTSFFFLR